MKKQTGFTLIELVVVIVILGILAATAAPKFIDLTGDARTSVMEALQGSLKSARDMAHAKALVDSETGSSGEISVAGKNVTLAFGWPDVSSISSIIDFDGDISTTTPGTFFYDGAPSETSCSVTYAAPTSADDAPAVTLVDTGC